MSNSLKKETIKESDVSLNNIPIDDLISFLTDIKNKYSDKYVKVTVHSTGFHIFGSRYYTDEERAQIRKRRIEKEIAFLKSRNDKFMKDREKENVRRERVEKIEKRTLAQLKRKYEGT